MSYHQPDAASATLAVFCLPARRMHRESARPADGFWRGMSTPSLPQKRALAPPPRLRAKHASFCALCAGRPSPARAGAARQKRRFKNCANLCTFLQLVSYKKTRRSGFFLLCSKDVLDSEKHWYCSERIRRFIQLNKTQTHIKVNCIRICVQVNPFNRKRLVNYFYLLKEFT